MLLVVVAMSTGGSRGRTRDEILLSTVTPYARLYCMIPQECVVCGVLPGAAMK